MAGPRLGCTHERGRKARADLRRLIRNAPPDGLRVADLAAAIGATVEKARWHLKQIPDAIQAPTKAMRFRNWFHVSQQAQCDAYTRSRDDQPVIAGPSLTSRELVLQAIVGAGALGRSQAELCEATGFSMGTLWAILPQLYRDQKVERDRDTVGKSANSKRYWGFGLKPVSAPAVTPATKPKRLAKQSQDWNANGLKAAKLPPQPIKVSNVDESRAVRIYGPAPVDNRFTVQQPERFFSAMTPGSYPPADTAIARAYGGGR